MKNLTSEIIPLHESSKVLGESARVPAFSTDAPSAHSDWATAYIDRRDSDVYRCAKDTDLIKKRMEGGSTVFEHGAAPFVLSHASTLEGYELYAGDTSGTGGLDAMPL